jgi:hypothetical protein
VTLVWFHASLNLGETSLGRLMMRYLILIIIVKRRRRTLNHLRTRDFRRTTVIHHIHQLLLLCDIGKCIILSYRLISIMRLLFLRRVSKIVSQLLKVVKHILYQKIARCCRLISGSLDTLRCCWGTLRVTICVCLSPCCLLFD